MADGAGFTGVAGAQDDRACAVTEDDRVGPVVRVDDRGVGVRADQQDAFGHPGRDEAGGRGQPVDEPGAYGADVERRCSGQAETVGHEGGGRRAGTVRGRGGDDDGVHGVHTRGPQGSPACLRGQVGGGLAGFGEVAAADSGTGADPGVGGVEPFGELLVGHDTWREPAGEPAQNGSTIARWGGGRCGQAEGSVESAGHKSSWVSRHA